MYKKPNSGKRSGNLSQYGLIDIPGSLDDEEPMDMSDDDIDLEAELAALSGGRVKHQRPKKPVETPANLDAMIQESLRDVSSEDDGSGEDDDPDLLSELKELGIEEEEAPRPVLRPAPPPPSITPSTQNSTVSLLEERIANYTAAEKQAKENNESSRARRFGRGLKTLNDLLKQAKAGRAIKEDDIPPAVPVTKPVQDSPSPPAIPPRTTSIEAPTAPEPSLPEPKEPPPPLPDRNTLDPEKEKGLLIILKRKEEFKAAALERKRAGDKATALEFLKVVKQFDLVVDAYKQGQEMDLNELPTPQQIAEALKAQAEPEPSKSSHDPVPTSSEPAQLVEASTVDEALKLRLKYFQEQEAKSKEQGNTSKARRMGRIVKQYLEAIKLHSAGKPIDKDELPTPPGFAPFPESKTPGAPTPPRPVARPAPTRHDKQLAALLLRQKAFKDAAIREKKAGNIEQAKDYLRSAKGFDSVIEAARGGLVVDFKSLPLPPQEKTKLEQTFDVISAEDCCEPADEALSLTDGEEVMTTIYHQLTTQLRLCLANREHYKAMGNVAEMNRFDNLGSKVKQDLDVVTVAKSLGQAPPKCHYESRQFSVVQCNTDLNENDLELTIVRGIAFNVPNPKEIDTYVKFEFPYPQETPVVDRTGLVKDTNSPDYASVFPLTIARGARACLRVFKRHALKLTVCSRGGWFSRDAPLGTVIVKLAPLETQCTIHESFPLMDGRRPAGGSLEVKLRVRTPLLQQQIENTTHRWLVLDN